MLVGVFEVDGFASGQLEDRRRLIVVEKARAQPGCAGFQIEAFKGSGANRDVDVLAGLMTIDLSKDSDRISPLVTLSSFDGEHCLLAVRT